MSFLWKRRFSIRIHCLVSIVPLSRFISVCKHIFHSAYSIVLLAVVSEDVK